MARRKSNKHVKAMIDDILRLYQGHDLNRFGPNCVILNSHIDDDTIIGTEVHTYGTVSIKANQEEA